MMAGGALATARLHWQMGSWDKLAELQVETPQKGSLSRDQVELLLYRMQGLFVSGAVEEGRALAAALRRAGVARRTLAAGLLSGAASSLARARLINGQPAAARQMLASAVALNPEAGDTKQVATLRFEGEQRNVAAHRSAASSRLPYIDVIGPSGAGKTTLLKALAEQEGFVLLKKPGPEQITAADASHMMFSFMLDHSGFVRHVADALQCTPDSDKLHRFLEDALVRYTSAAPIPGALHLFDEGFVCRANSLFAYTDGPLDEGAVRGYLRSAPLPAALIVLRAPPDVCVERLNAKPKGLAQRMRGLNEQERNAILQKMSRIADIAGAEMQTLKVLVVEPDPSATISDISAKVSETIRA